MSLFWYPELNYKNEQLSKAELLDSYIRYYLARLQSMFKYENLPETIPAKWLEHYLLNNGNCIIAKVGDDLYALVGGMGQEATPYYIPAGYVVANPWIKTEGGTLSKQYWTANVPGHDQDAVIIFNDTYSQGVIPMLVRYCTQLVENDLSMGIADILARATLNISAADDNTKQSAELWLKRLKDGNLGVISDNAFIEGLEVREFKSAAESLTSLIEYHQYIKASLFNELGLNSNYNMKRESINSNESQLNDDMLHPLIDDMLRERQEGIKRVNEFFGTDIKVSFNSAWEANEIEESSLIEEIEAGAVAAEAQAIAAIESISTEGASDETISDNIDLDNNVMDSEDNVTPTEIDNGTGQLEDEIDIEETTEETSEEVDIEEVKEDIEDVKEVFDDLIEEESEETKEEEEEENAQEDK